MKKAVFLLLLISFVALNTVAAQERKEGVMNLSSPEFKNNDFIPRKFTCQGDDVNPALFIENAPKDTKSLSLIVDDPDAPVGTWVHWVVYNIPLASCIEEDSIPGDQAMNDFRRKDYGGPCPPSGIHRYFFKIYALDTKLELKENAGRRELEEAMQGHILDVAELIGLYKRQ